MKEPQVQDRVYIRITLPKVKEKQRQVVGEAAANTWHQIREIG